MGHDAYLAASFAACSGVVHCALSRIVRPGDRCLIPSSLPMADVIPTLLMIWLILFVVAGLHALVRRSTGLSLLEAIGLSWIISRFFK